MRYDFGAALAGLVFVALGAAFLADAVDAADFRFDLLMPLAAIGVGIAAIVSALTRPRS